MWRCLDSALATPGWEQQTFESPLETSTFLLTYYTDLLSLFRCLVPLFSAWGELSEPGSTISPSLWKRRDKCSVTDGIMRAWPMSTQMTGSTYPRLAGGGGNAEFRRKLFWHRCSILAKNGLSDQHDSFLKVLASSNAIIQKSCTWKYCFSLLP